MISYNAAGREWGINEFSNLETTTSDCILSEVDFNSKHRRIEVIS